MAGLGDQMLSSSGGLSKAYAVASLFGQNAPAGPVFKHGVTKNYATIEDRADYEKYERGQTAKGGRGGRSGWNTQAAGDPGFQYSNLQINLEQSRRSPGTTHYGRGGGWTPQVYSGSTPQSARAGVMFNLRRGTQQHTSRDYPLGAPSVAWWRKFGGASLQGDQGWKRTLTRSAGSASTTSPSQMYKKEVFQTREVRSKGNTRSFKLLPKHPNAPLMNPDLAYMYRRNSIQLGPVRRSTRRLF